MSLRVVPPPSPLTPAQRALFDSEPPDLAADAADHGYRELGGKCFRHLSRAEMLSIATIAAMEATVTFDPALGAKYRPWAFFRAMGAVLNAAKREGMQYRKTNALIRAHMMAHFGRATARSTSASHGRVPHRQAPRLQQPGARPGARGRRGRHAGRRRRMRSRRSRRRPGRAKRSAPCSRPWGRPNGGCSRCTSLSASRWRRWPRRWASTSAGARPSRAGSTRCSPRSARASWRAVYARCRRGRRTCRAARWAARSELPGVAGGPSPSCPTIQPAGGDREGASRRDRYVAACRLARLRRGAHITTRGSAGKASRRDRHLARRVPRPTPNERLLSRTRARSREGIMRHAGVISRQAHPIDLRRAGRISSVRNQNVPNTGANMIANSRESVSRALARPPLWSTLPSFFIFWCAARAAPAGRGPAQVRS